MLVTIAAAAEQWTVSQATIRRLIRRGELPIIRLGSAVRIAQTALDEYVRGKEWRSVNLAAGGASSSSKGERAYSSACRPVSRKRKRKSMKPSSAEESSTAS